jgi:signal transduction histidine kinase
MLLPADSRDHLYRIAQEALSNALRHARARHIELRLVTTPMQVTLEIRDDGQGWRPSLERSGLGLHTMRFRAAALRGRLVTEFIEGGGTTVRCTCPNRRLSRASLPSR